MTDSAKKLPMNKARGKRIAEARRVKRISQEELALAISSLKSEKGQTDAAVTRGAIGNWERGFGITTANLSLVATVLNVTTGWLEAGEGQTGGKEDKEGTASGKGHVPVGKAVLEIDVRGGAGMGGEATVHNFTASNGHTQSADDVAGEWHFPAGYLAEIRVDPARVRIIEVTGDSMTRPDGSGLLSGDRIMMDTGDRNPSPPGIFVLWDGFGVIVKRLERVPRSDPPAIRIISDNPSHAAYELTGEEVQIIGRVIWFARKM